MNKGLAVSTQLLRLHLPVKREQRHAKSPAANAKERKNGHSSLAWDSALRAGRGAHCPSVFVRRPSLLEMSALFIYLYTGYWTGTTKDTADGPLRGRRHRTKNFRAVNPCVCQMPRRGAAWSTWSAVINRALES